jgi:DNA-3-methyladenine glycosylase II
MRTIRALARLLIARLSFGKQGPAMGLSAQQIKHSLDAVAQREPGFAKALKLAGYPEPRIRARGYATLMRTIVGQQVSVAAAASMWRKFEAHLGPELPPDKVLESDFDSLRACGLSRQKQGYMRSLCELVVTGALDFEDLPADDEEAIARLTRIKGIGRWSAEIYLLFAEGRPDIWPAGDLAVQAGLHKLLGLEARPSEKATRDMAEAWRPHRGATAIFTWHCYNNPAL